MILDERLRWNGVLDAGQNERVERPENIMTRFVMPGKKAALLRRQRRESRI